MPRSPLAPDEINKIADVLVTGRNIPEWSSLSDADKAAINTEVERLDDVTDPTAPPTPDDIPDPTVIPDDLLSVPKF